ADLVGAVPGTVLGNENGAVESIGKHVAGVEAHTQRGHVRTQFSRRRRVIAAGMSRAVLRIGHIAAMTVRIAEMFVAAVDTVELVSRSVVAEHIAAVVSEPQLVAVRLPVETDRVANAAGLRAPVAAVGVHAEQAGERGWRIAAVAR